MASMSTLDNRLLVKELDTRNYLSHILEGPQQLVDGYRLGEQITLPALYAQSKQVVIIPSGEIAPIAYAIASLAAETSRAPVCVLEDFLLPQWIGRDTLVIALDYTGASAAVLAAYRQAVQRRARTLAVSLEGELSRESRRARSHHVTIEYGALARVASFYVLGVAAAVAKKLDLIDLKGAMVDEAADLGRALLENINPDVAHYQNNAKQLAQKAFGRPVIVVSGLPLETAAVKWGVSLSATGKQIAVSVPLARFSDTLINGLYQPAKPADAPLVVMLQSKYDHQQTKVSQTLVYQVAQSHKVVYEQVFMHPSGSLLGEMCLSSLLGEMVGYYVALLHHRDPSETEASDFVRAGLNETVES